ncbi:MAG TPA: hypothetical protein VL856_13360 [Acidimicrobiia bacterium]|nr:hypothetical protein [Acidimicrobiia bacterium]
MIDAMTPVPTNVVAWLAQQHAWERKLAELRYEARRAKAEPQPAATAQPAAEPTTTAA